MDVRSELAAVFAEQRAGIDAAEKFLSENPDVAELVVMARDAFDDVREYAAEAFAPVIKRARELFAPLTVRYLGKLL